MLRGVTSVGVTISLIVTAGCLGRVTAGPERLDCRRVDLDPRPAWTFSGEWARHGEDLLLLDVIAAQVLRINRDGEQSAFSLSRIHRPVEIRRTDRGFLVRGAEGLVELGEDLNPRWKAEWGDGSVGGVEHLSSLIVSDKSLLGVVGFGDESTGWWGFGRLRLDDPRSVERIRALPSLKTAEGDFYYAHSGPFLAKTTSGIYALIFGADPHIERIVPAVRRIATFPDEYRSPILPRATGPSTTAALYRAWELSTAPVALFGRADLLYLLTRKPRQDSGTQWKLHQLDPESDRVIHSIELPTRASHLVVVPGPRHWAIVEKGSVAMSGNPDQVIGPVLFIPTPLIEDRNRTADLSTCLQPGA